MIDSSSFNVLTDDKSMKNEALVPHTYKQSCRRMWPYANGVLTKWKGNKQQPEPKGNRDQML